MYLADLIVTVAVIRGLNKKLTRLDKVRADLRIVSDKLSDTLAKMCIRDRCSPLSFRIVSALYHISNENN